MEKIFYQSSMPRAGSTLLQQIVGQNPDFYVSPTSGLINMVIASKGAYTTTPEFKAVDRSITKEPFLQFCKGGIESYCNKMTDKKYVLDKSRGWGINYDFVKEVFKVGPKMVVMIRDLRDMVASMENKYRTSTTIESGTSNALELKGTTQFKRTVQWCSSMPIGPSLDWLLDIIQRGIAPNLLFIRYEDLLNEPVETMKLFYDYLEVDQYEHDFENIKQVTHENDEVHGIYGDHRIKEGQLTEYKSNFEKLLTKESIQYLENNYKWYFDVFKYQTTKDK